MISWFAQFEQRKKPLNHITSPELQAIVEPLKNFLGDQLSSLDNDDTNISVVFEWSAAGVLGFTLEGDADCVDAAIALIGELAEFQSLQS